MREAEERQRIEEEVRARFEEERRRFEGEMEEMTAERLKGYLEKKCVGMKEVIHLHYKSRKSEPARLSLPGGAGPLMRAHEGGQFVTIGDIEEGVGGFGSAERRAVYHP